MSITDKELLTFCNLANLEMEYANITYKVTEGQDEVERNHTIYSLLSQGRNEDNIGKLDIDLDSIDENVDGDKSYIINLGKIFRERNQKIAERKKKKDPEIEDLYNEGREIIRSAPIVFDYLDSSLNKFLKEWEIVYAETLKGTIYDYIYDMYVEVFSKESEDYLKNGEQLYTKEELIDKLEIERELKDDKDLEININLSKRIEEKLKKDQRRLIEYGVIAQKAYDLSKNVGSIVGGGSGGANDKIYNFLDKTEIKEESFVETKKTKVKIPALGNGRGRGNIAIGNKPSTIEIEMVKRINKTKKITIHKFDTILDVKIKEILIFFEKRGIYIEKKVLKKVGSVGGAVTKSMLYLAIVEEASKFNDKISNFLKSPKMTIDSLKIRESDLRLIILKKKEEFVVVFNNFKDKYLNKILKSGILINDLSYIMNTILKKVVQNISTKKEADCLKEAISILNTSYENSNITFTGFGNAGKLATLFGGLLRKKVKVFEDKVEKNELSEIYLFSRNDIDVIDGNIDLGCAVFFSDLLGFMYNSILGTTVAKFAFGIAFITGAIATAVVGQLIILGILAVLLEFIAYGIVVGVIFFVLNCIREYESIREIINILKGKKYLINYNDNFYFVSEKIVKNDYLKIASPEINFILDYLDKNNKNGYYELVEVEDATEYNENNEFLTTPIKVKKIILKLNSDRSVDFKNSFYLYEVSHSPMQYASENPGKEILAKDIVAITSEEDLKQIVLLNFSKVQKTYTLYKVLNFYYDFQKNINKEKGLEITNFEYIYLNFKDGNYILSRTNNLERIVEKRNGNKIGEEYLEPWEIVSEPDRKELEKELEKMDSSEKAKEIKDNISSKQAMWVSYGVPTRFNDEYKYFPFIDGDNLTEKLNENYSISALNAKVEKTLENKITKEKVEAIRYFVEQGVNTAEKIGNVVDRVENAIKPVEEAFSKDISIEDGKIVDKLDIV